MTTVILTLAVSAIALLLIGMPIAYALSASGVFALMVKGGTPLLVFPQRFFNAINSFSLMAIIFFVIAGELMMQGGISQRIVNFAQLFLGRLRGSLSFINFICCAFFGAISGSALATSRAPRSRGKGILQSIKKREPDEKEPFRAGAVFDAQRILFSVFFSCG